MKVSFFNITTYCPVQTLSWNLLGDTSLSPIVGPCVLLSFSLTLCKPDTSLKWTFRFGFCSFLGGHLSMRQTASASLNGGRKSWSGELTVDRAKEKAIVTSIWRMRSDTWSLIAASLFFLNYSLIRPCFFFSFHFCCSLQVGQNLCMVLLRDIFFLVATFISWKETTKLLS